MIIPKSLYHPMEAVIAPLPLCTQLCTLQMMIPRTTRLIGIRALRAQLSTLIEEARRKNIEFILTRHGEIVGHLLPPTTRESALQEISPSAESEVTREDQPTIAALRPTVLRITKRYGVRNVRVFGSFAQGEQTKTSDVDLLVDVPDHMSLWELSGLKIDLEKALKRKVDVVPADCIKPLLRSRILSEAIPL
jgi:uncharacterized protein